MIEEQIMAETQILVWLRAHDHLPLDEVMAHLGTQATSLDIQAALRRYVEEYATNAEL